LTISVACDVETLSSCKRTSLALPRPTEHTCREIAYVVPASGPPMTSSVASASGSPTLGIASRGAAGATTSYRSSALPIRTTSLGWSARDPSTRSPLT
jgi:hypothetical protein